VFGATTSGKFGNPVQGGGGAIVLPSDDHEADSVGGRLVSLGILRETNKLANNTSDKIN